MSTLQRRRREKELRREEILQAAEKIFARKGFDATVMTDIAEEVELSKGTLYLYFTGKEELAFAIFLKNLLHLKTMIREAADAETKGIDKVRSILRAYFHFYRDHFYIREKGSSRGRFYLNRIFAYYFQGEHTDAAFAKKCFKTIDEILDIIVEAAQSGMADGSIRSDLDPMKTAVTYGNLVLMFMLRLSQGQELVIRGHGYTPEELLNHMFDIILASMEKAR